MVFEDGSVLFISLLIVRVIGQKKIWPMNHMSARALTLKGLSCCFSQGRRNGTVWFMSSAAVSVLCRLKEPHGFLTKVQNLSTEKHFWGCHKSSCFFVVLSVYQGMPGSLKSFYIPLMNLSAVSSWRPCVSSWLPMRVSAHSHRLSIKETFRSEPLIKIT